MSSDKMPAGTAGKCYTAGHCEVPLMKTRTTNHERASVHVLIEPLLKRKAEKVFRANGLSTTEAIARFYELVSARKKVPLPISKNIPNAETVKVLEDSVHGRNLREYASVEEMFSSILGKDWREQK